MSKSKNNKELVNEEVCLFQLICSKKKEFLNFYTEFFINLPGFLNIYKDKFFAKLNEFINDKHYINTLKDKCHEISLNYKCINELDEKYLGNKRKRDKIYNIDENSKINNEPSKYDAELKLLKNDYPKFDENDDESTEYLLVKKGKDVEILSSTPPITINIKKIKLEKEEKNKNNYKNVIKDEKMIKDDKNTNNIININIDDKKENKSYEEKGSKLNNKLNPIRSKRKDNSKTNQSELKIKEEQISIVAPKNDNVPKNKFLQKFSSQLSSFEELNSLNDNSLSNEDLFMSENSDYLNKLAPSSLGINSRLERMPKLSILKKKNDIKFSNLEAFLDDIKENIIYNDKEDDMQNIEKKISKNSSPKDTPTLNKNINNKFYVPNNIINNKNNNDNENSNNNNSVKKDMQNNINEESKNIKTLVDNEEEEIKEEKSNNNNNNQYESENKKEKKETTNKKEEMNNNKNDIFPEPNTKIMKNENIIILNTLLLEYNNNDGSKIIKKTIEIPNSVIIQKSVLNMGEISNYINIQKNKKIKHKEKKEKNNQLTNITNIKSNSINENNKPKIPRAKRRNIILMEKTFCEEDNNYNENRKNRKIKDSNQNTVVNSKEENLNATDILNGFNYLYQQKSQ